LISCFFLPPHNPHKQQQQQQKITTKTTTPITMSTIANVEKMETDIPEMNWAELSKGVWVLM
jgi:hypothetical protein